MTNTFGHGKRALLHRVLLHVLWDKDSTGRTYVCILNCVLFLTSGISLQVPTVINNQTIHWPNILLIMPGSVIKESCSDFRPLQITTTSRCKFGSFSDPISFSNKKPSMGSYESEINNIYSLYKTKSKLDM